MSINAFSVLLAQQTEMVHNQTGDMLKSLGMMAMIMVVFWFLMIQPQRKKAKELENQLKTLKPGDKIITNSGIMAVVLSIKEKSMTIRSADTKLEILKSAVADVTDRSGDAVEAQS